MHKRHVQALVSNREHGPGVLFVKSLKVVEFLSGQKSGRSVAVFRSIRQFAILLPSLCRAMTKMTPSATGSLGKSPFLHLLVSALEHESTGTLVIETPQGARSALRLERGIPVKFRTAEPLSTLGALLAELGWVNLAQCEQSFEEAASAGRLHGEYLVESGMLSADVVTRGLRLQMLRKLSWACTLPESSMYGLYEGQDFIARWAGAGTPISPLHAAWRLAREMRESPAFTHLMERVTSQVLKIHPEAVLQKFGFDSAERAVLDALKATPQTFIALTKLDALPVPILERAVYVLTLTRQFDLGTGSRPMGVGVSFEHIHELLQERKTRSARPVTIVNKPVAAPTATPASIRETQPSTPEGVGTKPNPELAERRRALQQLSDSQEQMNFYELLGIAREASKEQVQAAFFHLAKQYHPDKLGPELADMRDASARLFSRLTEAQQTLFDESRRASYDRQLSQGIAAADDEQQRIQAVVHAATSYQKAEVLFKKRMLAAAELEAARAHESDPDQADYLALLAWIQASKPNAELQLPQVLDQLNRALRMEPESEKTHFYRAQVLSRLGRQREALADYRFVVSKNPHHIDALRELRIWEMRRKGHESTLPPGAARTSSPAPGASRRPSDPRNPVRTSTTPSPRQPQSLSPKPGMLSKLFKR